MQVSCTGTTVAAVRPKGFRSVEVWRDDRAPLLTIEGPDMRRTGNAQEPVTHIHVTTGGHRFSVVGHRQQLAAVPDAELVVGRKPQLAVEPGGVVPRNT